MVVTIVATSIAVILLVAGLVFLGREIDGYDMMKHEIKARRICGVLFLIAQIVSIFSANGSEMTLVACIPLIIIFALFILISPILLASLN